MKKFGITPRGGSTSASADTSSSPFDIDRPRSVAGIREHDTKTVFNGIASAFSPRGLTNGGGDSSVQRNGSFAARLNSLRQKYGPNGKRSDSPSIGQPTDVRLVNGRSPVNYITSNGSPKAATPSPNYYMAGRSSSLGITRFDDLPPSPLGSHPVTAEDFHSVASRSADEKHFRCIIKDSKDYREAELILKGMVAEAGGKVLDATHRWPGGFFYSMEDTSGENPLADGDEAPHGGRISVTPFKPSVPVSFNDTRSMMRANVVEIPPRAESRGQGKRLPPLPPLPPFPPLPAMEAADSGGTDSRAVAVFKKRRFSIR